MKDTILKDISEESELAAYRSWIDLLNKEVDDLYKENLVLRNALSKAISDISTLQTQNSNLNKEISVLYSRYLYPL